MRLGLAMAASLMAALGFLAGIGPGFAWANAPGFVRPRRSSSYQEERKVCGRFRALFRVPACLLAKPICHVLKSSKAGERLVVRQTDWTINPAMKPLLLARFHSAGQDKGSGEDADGGDSEEGNREAQRLARLRSASGGGVAAEGASLGACLRWGGEGDGESRPQGRVRPGVAISLREGEQAKQE